MDFLDTNPAAIQALQPGDAWACFHVEDPRQVAQSLQLLVREETPLALGFAGEAVTPAVLWAADAGAGLLRLRLTGLPAENEKLLRLLPAEPPPGATPPALFAAAYREGAKLQFDLPAPLGKRHAGDVMLHAQWPRQLVQWPRRSKIRVKRRIGQSPSATFAHPLATDYVLSLRVLDISAEGCALWLPRGEPPLAPGQVLRQVEVELDDDSILFADLLIQHISLGGDAMPTLPMGQAEGLRVGCRWCHLSAQAAQLLESWIRRGRRRRDLVHLALDD
jgi:flagellar brake protein